MLYLLKSQVTKLSYVCSLLLATSCACPPVEMLTAFVDLCGTQMCQHNRAPVIPTVLGLSNQARSRYSASSPWICSHCVVATLSLTKHFCAGRVTIVAVILLFVKIMLCMNSINHCLLCCYHIDVVCLPEPCRCTVQVPPPLTCTVVIVTRWLFCCRWCRLSWNSLRLMSKNFRGNLLKSTCALQTR